MTLYEINNKYAALMEMYEAGEDEAVDTETGEVLDIKEALDELEISKEEKVNATILYLKNLQNLKNGIKSEIDTLKKRMDKAEKERANLESYLLSNIGEAKKLETPQYKLTVRPSVETIVPTKAADIEKIPAEYRKESVKWTVSKTAVKAALEAGKQIAGCQLVYKKNLKY